MKDYNRILKECYNKKCKNEVKLLSKIDEERLNMIGELFNNYNNKIITKKEFIAKTKKLENDYYKKKEAINLLKCQLDNCYDYAKIIIHQLSNKIKYTKKDVYDVDEYIKILKLHSYYNSTLLNEHVEPERYNKIENNLNKIISIMKIKKNR